MSVNMGVLSIQGDIDENLLATTFAIKELEVAGTVYDVNTSDDIADLDGLIIPGGESTTIGYMSKLDDILDVIQSKISVGMPVLGICAGLIMLSSSTADSVVGKTGQPLLGALDIDVERNAFGNQSMSFQSNISMKAIGISKFPGIFIRAPLIKDIGSTQVIAKLGDMPVAVKTGNVIGTSFHPELTYDISIHKYLVGLAVDFANDK